MMIRLREKQAVIHGLAHLPIVFALAVTSLPLFTRVTLPTSLYFPLLAIGGITSYGRQ